MLLSKTREWTKHKTKRKYFSQWMFVDHSGKNFSSIPHREDEKVENRERENDGTIFIKVNWLDTKAKG